MTGYDLEGFSLRQMILSSRALRQLGSACGSLEEAAQEVVDFFYDSFESRVSRERACVLVRCFKTHRFGDLPPDLREVATLGLQGGRPDESMMCLVLLATRGTRPEWETRHGSKGHRAIPFATAAMIERAPMIARMVEQIGLQPSELLKAEPEALTAWERRTLDVFHVERAAGSPFVPAQKEFVEPFGVKSVLGFGGQLPNGELFFVLLFSKVAILQETAALFRTLALCVKLVFLGQASGRTFRP